MEGEKVLSERELRDKKKAEENQARQIRLGDIPDPNVVEEEETSESTPKAKATPQKKST